MTRKPTVWLVDDLPDNSQNFKKIIRNIFILSCSQTRVQFSDESTTKSTPMRCYVMCSSTIRPMKLFALKEKSMS
jgi:hypothetical protein